MGLSHSPSIVTSNLVFAIDAANIKSINQPTTADHAWADWYCMVSGTATYSIVDSGVSIYQRTSAGVVTTIVGPSTGPTRGTLNVTIGNTYYGDGPINLVVEDGQHCLVPTTLAGTLFWSDSARAATFPHTVLVYSPFGAAQLKFFDSTSTGIYGNPNSVLNVTQGSTTVFSTSNIGGFAANGQVWVTSNIPVVATANTTTADKTILVPMSQYVYRIGSAYYSSEGNSYTSIISNVFTLYSSNTSQKVMDMGIADGSGGDSNQGLGLQYLSENYSWGNYLSDYYMVAPYSPTNITVQHWNGSVWTTFEKHTLTGGTILNATAVARDGTANVGNAATNVSGTASYFNASQLWRWIGDKPFFLRINDTADDEFSVLGWTHKSSFSKPRTANTVIDLSRQNRNGSTINGLVIDSNNLGSIVFNESNNRMTVASTAINYYGGTFELWFNIDSIDYDQGFLTHIQAYPYINLWMPGNIGLVPASAGKMRWEVLRSAGVGGSFLSNTTFVPGRWYHVVGTFGTDGSVKLYVNSELDNSTTSTSFVPPLTTTAPVILGAYDSIGSYPSRSKIAVAKIYNRDLSPLEIKQNFNALRGRFGI